MPFSCLSFRGAQCLRRPIVRSFLTTIVRPGNHYDTLGVSSSATAKEIKSSYFKLSKTHHPDRNRNDEGAAKRFIKINEAYSILKHPDKRHSYDRDVLNLHKPPTRTGSHFSSGPAGGRPASGLSRRRTHFRGPPPSFYRSGGWGEHSEKRRAAAEGAYPKNTDSASTTGGMGPGQNPFGNVHSVPHFDREGHLRTHSNHDRRKKDKMRGTVMEHAMPSGTMLGSFFLISGLITVFMVGPWWLFDRNQSERIRSDISATSRRREEGKSGIEMKDVKSVR